MPFNAQGKPCGDGGKPSSTIPAELMEVLQNNEGVSRQDIRRLMHYRYCPRTICTHLQKLRIAKKVECYVNGSMRKPLYRIVRP